MLPGEALRDVMRSWTSGVAIATSQYAGIRHGMTVNSFTSLSLDPPLVSITLANDTRTHLLVTQSGVFGITILSRDQQPLALIFAGKGETHSGAGRFDGVETFHLASEAPLIRGGLAFLDCKVVHVYEMKHSTLFVGEVQAAQRAAAPLDPLVYINRGYPRLEV